MKQEKKEFVLEFRKHSLTWSKLHPIKLLIKLLQLHQFEILSGDQPLPILKFVENSFFFLIYFPLAYKQHF